MPAIADKLRRTQKVEGSGAGDIGMTKTLLKYPHELMATESGSPDPRSRAIAALIARQAVSKKCTTP
jgi:hypothetical protein